MAIAPHLALGFCAALGVALVLGWPADIASDRVASDAPTAQDESEAAQANFYIGGIVIPPPPRPVVAINSLPGSAQRPLAEWRIFRAAAAGALEAIERGETVAAGGGSLAAQSGDVLTVRGWTGDSALGIRLPHAALAMCNQIVAVVRVDLPRQDIADTLHPNLANSGWQARLLARDLPRCEGLSLQAYGVAASHRLIVPLGAPVALSIVDTEKPLSFDVERVAASARLEDIPEASPSASIAVSSTTNLRRCGDLKCDLVGALATGRYTVSVLDQTDEWMLISAPGAAGWAAKRVMRAELLSSAARI